MTAQIDSGEPARGDRPDRELLQALASSETFGLTGAVSVHETHASWVFVCSTRAYKIKKPVALAFLDYSTLALRRAACREEVRINRELARGLYLGVRAIVRTASGFRLGGEDAPDAVEYAVEMCSFREADTLAGLIAADALTPAQLAAVARRLAAFHRIAPRVPGGSPPEVLAMWRANLDELAALAASIAPRWNTGLAAGFGAAFLGVHEAEVELRRERGLVRDGHGDLRCEHVLAVPAVRVVDRVEFDPALRRCDIACDLAFLTMDLEALGRRRAAEELLSDYRREGMDPGSGALIAFYGAHRAFVRAKVALVSATEREGPTRAQQLDLGQSLWELGERLCWRARAPVAVVICGPAATGKSTLARELARRSGLRVLSSDETRKSAAGLAARERAAPELYAEPTSRATYERLGEEARRVLEREDGVIVDATCRSREHRALLFDQLRREGLTRLVVRCEVPLEVALERAAHRMHDPQRISDAAPAVVSEQFFSFDALQELDPETLLALDCAQALDVQVDAVASRVDRNLHPGLT